MREIVEKFSSTLSIFLKGFDAVNDSEIKYFLAQDGAWDFVREVYTRFSLGRIQRYEMEAALQKYAFFEERLTRYTLLHFHERLKGVGGYSQTQTQNIENIKSAILHDLDANSLR